MKSVDLTVRIPESTDLPVSERIAGAIHREEVLSWEFDEPSETVLFVSVIVGDRTVVEEAATDIESITRFETTPIDGDTFYGCVEADLGEIAGSFVELFDSSDVVVIPPMVYTGERLFSMTILGSEGALQGFLSDVPPRFDVEIERFSEHRRRTEPMVGRLTARQFASLEVAAELGYFTVPRDASLAEVAGELGCSESTASTLIRTAVRNLVDAAVALE